MGVPRASSHYAPKQVFHYCLKMLPCGLGCGLIIEKSGERGRNRTFSLLIKR
jgi:hypothetical protein